MYHKSSNIRLSAVNSTVVQDKEKIFNEVSQELTAQVDLTSVEVRVMNLYKKQFQVRKILV